MADQESGEKRFFYDWTKTTQNYDDHFRQAVGDGVDALRRADEIAAGSHDQFNPKNPDSFATMLARDAGLSDSEARPRPPQFNTNMTQERKQEQNNGSQQEGLPDRILGALYPNLGRSDIAILQKLQRQERLASQQSNTQIMPVIDKGVQLSRAQQAAQRHLVANPDQILDMVRNGKEEALNQLGFRFSDLPEKAQRDVTRGLGRGVASALGGVGDMFRRGGPDALRNLSKGAAKAMEIRAKGDAAAQLEIAKGQRQAIVIDANTRRRVAEIVAPATADTIRKMPTLARETRFTSSEIGALTESVKGRTALLVNEARVQAREAINMFSSLADRLNSLPRKVTEQRVEETFAHPAKPARGDRGARQESERIERRISQTRTEKPPTLRLHMPKIELPSAEETRTAYMAAGPASVDMAYNHNGDFSVHASSTDYGAAAGAFDHVEMHGGSVSGAGVDIEY